MNSATENGQPFLLPREGVDVEALMADIEDSLKQKVAHGALTEKELEEIARMELRPLPDFQDVPHTYENHLFPPDSGHRLPFIPDPEHASGPKGLVKKVFKRVRRLLMPLLRFLFRPFREEIMAWSLELHNELRPSVLQGRDYIRLLHNALSNLITETTKLKIEEEQMKIRLRSLEERMLFLEKRQRSVEEEVFPPQ